MNWCGIGLAAVSGAVGAGIAELIFRGCLRRGFAGRGRICSLTIDLYQEILALPQAQQGPALRYLFTE